MLFWTHHIYLHVSYTKQFMVSTGIHTKNSVKNLNFSTNYFESLMKHVFYEERIYGECRIN